MNGAFPEMLHCITSSPEMTVLERQRARLRWHQEQSFFNGAGTEFGAAAASFYLQGGNFLGFGEGMEAAQMTVKPDPSLEIEHHWGGFGCLGFEGSSLFEMNGGISRTASCPPAVAATAAVATMEARGGGDSAVLMEMKVSAQVGKESFKKRKLDSALTKKDEDESHETKDKKIKVCIEDMESKITEQSNNNGNKKDSKNNKKEACGSTSKDNSKTSEVQKPDFIHVRARRGQATDSHSLAERVRREKISERMKFLQDLVPGCNKITGKAGMLDEIINYVQSLQRQVEFLSMKLAAVNPRLDFDSDSLFVKEMIPACTATYPTIDMPPEMANPAFLQFNPTQQPVSCSGLEMAINPDMGLRRTTSAPVSSPETFIDSSCFTQLQQPSTWDNDLQSLYNLEFHHGRATSYPSHQQFMGSIEASNLKMEM